MRLRIIVRLPNRMWLCLRRRLWLRVRGWMWLRTGMWLRLLLRHERPPVRRTEVLLRRLRQAFTLVPVHRLRRLLPDRLRRLL